MTINKKSKGFLFTKNAGILVFAALMRCISVYIFTVPNKFAPGGVTGIASMLYNSPLKLNVSIMLFVLNIPLLILAFFKMNKGFALKTAIVIALLSVGVELMGRFNVPQYGINEGADKMLASLFGGAFAGISLALTFKVNASSGGTDVVGAVIQKRYSATNVAWFILAFDSIIIVVSGFVFNDFVPVMYSFVSLFVTSKVSEIITNGFTTAVTFTVITKKPKEFGMRVINELHRGVTSIKSVGLYTGLENTVLQCVVRKRQVSEFHRILKETDKDAFAYAMPATEVLGQGFTEDIRPIKRNDGEK
ncbi:MAG: YitT family protein [Clostridiales bacterium]|jgi:uncharacterized membrane-anchored protein YitT (DUF2179 family)|nr:YitT family protein [Clostridiales bacterium]